MEAEAIAEKARKSISRFCIEECKSYCCRKGYLILDNSNIDLVVQGRKQELLDRKILIKKEINYSLYLGDYEIPCPSLGKDFKCLIHKKPERPSACKQFPLFIEGNKLRLSPRCPAVKADMLYPYIARLLKMGYRLEEANPFSDFDVNIKLDKVPTIKS